MKGGGSDGCGVDGEGFLGGRLEDVFERGKGFWKVLWISGGDNFEDCETNLGAGD